MFYLYCTSYQTKYLDLIRGVMKYDYIIVGSGLYGATFAYEARKRNKTCLVLEKRNHIGGNVYTKIIDGIQVHTYGAHIFHTSNEETWKYVNQFVNFKHYINSPLANYKGEIYNLPFNMNTFNKLWGVVKPDDARAIIEKQKVINDAPKNLEEQALHLVGNDIYEKLIKGYTEKQWGRTCDSLPAFIIKRLPVRYTYNNNYFDDLFQGIPEGGYTKLIEKMLDGIEVKLNTDYLVNKFEWDSLADKIVYSGPIDAYFNYQYGPLSYRSLRFETETLNMSDYQGNAVINYTDSEIPFTRIIEHKHFENTNQFKTVITKEYSKEWQIGDEPYYPVNDDKNSSIYKKYKLLTEQEDNVIFGGRLGTYRYLNMDQVIEIAREDASL